MEKGRPKQNKYKVKYMIERILEYTKKNKSGIPILKECCLENDWDYDYIMKLQRKDDDLRQSIKKLLYQKEVNLEKGGLTGKLEKTMAIFSLKQLGWKDKVDIDIESVTLEKLDEIMGAIDIEANS